MAGKGAHIPDNLGLPLPRLCLAITGHREANAAFAQNRPAIATTLARLFNSADSVVSRQVGNSAPSRLFSLLAHGADLLAVDAALARQWEVIAPLPFGLDLNIAINADPSTAEEARALLEGKNVDNPAVEARARHIRNAATSARLFELAEADEEIAKALLLSLQHGADGQFSRSFSDLASSRVAMAGRVMIEQSDLLIAIWDGVTPGAVGGTRHTIVSALETGTPVIWINAARPSQVALLHSPEDLYSLGQCRMLENEDAIAGFFDGIFNPPEADQDERAIQFHTEQWHMASARRFHAYRRIEALFGGSGLRQRFSRLRQRYETPDRIVAGSGAGLMDAMRAVPGNDPEFAARVGREVLQRFAWADGLSTYLSDAYRGGMVTNFILSALAIIVGISYLPLASVDSKWPFALMEFLLLASIVAITAIGRKRRWHGRWFETRRVAEYFRHAPIMLVLGVARASGRWPRGADTGWPEFYAKEVLRDLGLPKIRIDHDYLHAVLENLLLRHAADQRAYHEDKAKRLARVHHGLDQLSETLFKLAVLSVAGYLALLALASLGWLPSSWPHATSKSFTFLGVSLPALGGAIAGIRYFGDFERFASISEITAEKLAEVEGRIQILLNAPVGSLHYAQVASLAHGIDDIVVSEIENWQSVFGSKQIAVPV
ncbi:MAG: hypothetical protein ACK4SJ_09645 [Sphingorhabdus sp.]